MRVQRVSQVDGLGRLIRVCEVSSATLIGITGTPAPCGLDIPATGFLTTYQYSYDASGNHIFTVQQGGLNPRTAIYDSLGRLTRATNPESATIEYVYNADDLMTSQVAPAPNQPNPNVKVATNYTYDELHRLRTRTYQNDFSGTPAATFNYDQSAAFGVSPLTNTIGRASSSYVTNAQGQVLAAEVSSYDSMGRLLNNSQCTPQKCASSVFPITYTYDLIGNTLTGTNGLGITLTYFYNRAARLTALTSSLADANHPAMLLSGVHYNAFGGQTSASLGNSVNETMGYDPRGRLQSLNALKDTTTVYSFSLGYAGNGNVLTANDSVNANWTYSYDDFNRLVRAEPSGQTYWYTYEYDRFGNRWHQSLGGTGGPPGNVVNLSFDANNRIAPGNGVSYDAAGNVTNDGDSSYTYDAENRIISVSGSKGSGSYTYSAAGLRIRKTTPSGSVDYLYDLARHVITEVNASGVWTRVEIYAGSRHVATYKDGLSGMTYFPHADWQGTERARTGMSGTQPVETCTSLPFGDAMNCTGTSVSPIHFTGKERDSESDNDYFGARYYISRHGRWLTPDWSARQEPVPYADLRNPQTLNLFAYVGDSPVSRTDSDGHAGGDMKDDPWRFNSANHLWLVGGRIWSPNGGTAPITVNERVIWDTEANSGLGVTENQKKQFAAMQRETEQLYKQVNINLSVTYTEGAVTYTTGGNPVDVSGAISGALNVFVTNHRLGVAYAVAYGTGGEVSFIFKGAAYTFIGLAAAKHWSLSHGFAHHFLGNTMGHYTLWEKVLYNAYGDAYIDHYVLRNITAYGDSLRQYASSPCFTGGSCP